MFIIHYLRPTVIPWVKFGRRGLYWYFLPSVISVPHQNVDGSVPSSEQVCAIGKHSEWALPLNYALAFLNALLYFWVWGIAVPSQRAERHLGKALLGLETSEEVDGWERLGKAVGRLAERGKSLEILLSSWCPLHSLGKGCPKRCFNSC